MNRLILIGNGFDLAHGMKTGYNDFIIWYITSCFENVVKKGKYEDDFLSIKANTSYYVEQEFGTTDVKQYILDHYHDGTLADLMECENGNFPTFFFSNDSDNSDTIWTSAFKVNIKSKLLKQMVVNCKINNWVDIENLFYDLLKEALSDKNGSKSDEVIELNKSLGLIISELQVYLKNLGRCGENNKSFKSIMKDKIQWSEIVERAPLTSDDLNDTLPKKTLILNFNYTSTVERYLSNDTNIEINYIHGQLHSEDNPIIFGFGDELDDQYSKLELEKTKEIFKYIKSFWYFKTSNYHNLLRFIQGNPFQVYILGHSCGLSDRTMLNMIFEHENCLSIKIFYYQNPSTGENNYTELTEEISRHFKDKRQMRLKIVPFDKSSQIPQVSPF